jgi:hypothetical protein
MKLRAFTIFLLFPSSLLFSGSSLVMASTLPEQEIPTVKHCDLVNYPERYDQKIVRTQTSYFGTFDSAFLYDLTCNDKEHYTLPALDCQTDESCKPMQDIFNKNLEGDPFSGERVELIIVGRFKGPDKSGRRYGGQREFRFRFEIQRIEKAIPIPEKTPWPRT